MEFGVIDDQVDLVLVEDLLGDRAAVVLEIVDVRDDVIANGPEKPGRVEQVCPALLERLELLAHGNAQHLLVQRLQSLACLLLPFWHLVPGFLELLLEFVDGRLPGLLLFLG